MGKDDPKNVKKLAADAAKRAAAAKAKKEAKQPTVGKRMRRMGDKPKPKPPPKNVLKLIGDALKKKGK